MNRTASTESLINHNDDNQNNQNLQNHHHHQNDIQTINQQHLQNGVGVDANKTITSVISMSSTISHSHVRRMYHQKSLGYEGLDYDICENMLHLEEENNARRKRLGNNYLEFTRWLVIFFIGALTGLTACAILFSVEILTNYKYEKLMVCFVIDFHLSSMMIIVMKFVY